MMKTIVLIGLFALSLLPAFAGEPIPAGTISEGSLTNEKLMMDAMIGVAQKVGASGCVEPENFRPYIISMPEGKIGERSWSEHWVVQGCGKEFPVKIKFTEDGLDGANWIIN